MVYILSALILSLAAPVRAEDIPSQTRDLFVNGGGDKDYAYDDDGFVASDVDEALARKASENDRMPTKSDTFSKDVTPTKSRMNKPKDMEVPFESEIDGDLDDLG